jgi:serine/threonine protein kinase/WD40 repeat protein
MARPGADYNLLVGTLALQHNLISRDGLIAAMQAWVLDKGKSLTQILVAQGALTAEQIPQLDALVAGHLKQHEHNMQKSLAAVRAAAVPGDLSRIADADVQASLVHLSSDPQPSGATYVTREGSVGSAPAEPLRFRILRPHAQGGLGEVFVARDEELRREVALKQIQDRYADHPHSRARFRIEAEITGGLEHPTIVPVYGLGHYADGRPYYAMRFIRGDSLKEAVRRYHEQPAGRAKALAFRQLLSRFLDVCQAIAYAHSRGVLHRDLKPANVMLGTYGETLVVDWGLAKPLAQPEGSATAAERPLTPASASGTSPTEMGSALGTPQYMSPEQAAGHLDQLGAASDVYSLGATLYHMLTGQAPFQGTDVGLVLQQVQLGRFRPVRQVNPAVPPALEAICFKAMALAPQDRYPSARALADDIEHWLADEPVSVYQDPLALRLARWARRHKPLVTGAVAVLATAAVILGGGALLIEQARENEAQQKLLEQKARAQADELAAAEKKARVRAEGVRRQTLRTALADYRSSAEADLSAAQLMAHASAQADRQQAALDLLATAAGLGRKAEAALRQLGAEAGALAKEEPPAWQQRRLALRTEAARWLTRFDIGRGRTIHLPQNHSDFKPVVAVSPNGALLAAAYPTSNRLLLLRVDGGFLRALWLPPGMAQLDLDYGFDSLRFPTNHTIELGTPDDIITWALPEGKPQARARPAAEKKEVRARIAGRIEAEKKHAAALTVQTDRYTASITKAKHLKLVDIRSGLTAEQDLFAPEYQRAECLALLPFTGGVATLECLPGKASFGALQVTLWSIVTPRIWKYCLNHDLAVGGLAVAGDGLVVTGGQDDVVRFWKGPEETWAAGLSRLEVAKRKHFTQDPHQPTSPRKPGERFVLEPLEFFGHSQSRWRREEDYGADGTLLASEEYAQLRTGPDAGYNVRTSESSRSSRAVGLLNVPRADPLHDELYRAWGFHAEGLHPLRIDRLVSAAPGRRQWVTELYDPADGHLLHAFPDAGPGRILARSADQRYAVVVAEQKGDLATLELWLLDEAKKLGRLGEHLLRGEAKPGEVAPVFVAQFSPSGRWLLLIEQTTGRVEIWQSAQARQSGVITAPGPRVRAEFDPAENRLLLVGPSYRPGRPPGYKPAGRAFGQVVDLATATRICDLLDLDKVGWFADDAFRFTRDKLICVLFCTLNETPFEILMWDLGSGQRTTVAARPPGPPAPGQWDLQGGQVWLAPDRRHLVVSGTWAGHVGGGEVDRTYLQLWDLVEGKLLRGLLVDRMPFSALQLVPAQGQFYPAAAPHGLRPTRIYNAWRWADGKMIPSVPLALLAVPEDRKWALWRRAEGALLYQADQDRFRLLANSIGNFHFRAATPDGRLFVLEEIKVENEGGQAGRVRVRSGVWHGRSGHCLFMFPESDRFRAFDPSGAWAGTVDAARNEIRIWDTLTGRVAHVLKVPGLSANSPGYRVYLTNDSTIGRRGQIRVDPIDLRIHPDGSRIALVSQGVFQLWDLKAGRMLAMLPKPGHLSPVTCVAQHEGARLVASGGDEGVVLLWDREDGRPRGALLGHTAPITALAFSPDGGRLVSAAADGTLIVWRPDGKRRWTYRAPKPGFTCRCLRFRPHKAVLAAGTSDGRVLLIDARKEELLATHTTDGSAVQALAFSSDGDVLAAGTAAGRIHLWHGDRSKAQSWDSDTAVNALAFIPGKDLLASGGGALCFWQPGAGRQVLTVPVARVPVQALAVSQAGQELIVADQGGTVRVVDLVGLQDQLTRLGLELARSPGGQR